MNFINDVTSLLQIFGRSKNYSFLHLKKSTFDIIPQSADNENSLYMEYFIFSDTQIMNSRTVYSIVGVFGYVGGIISSIVIIIGFFMQPYSELSFRMQAVSDLYLSGTDQHSHQIRFS